MIGKQEKGRSFRGCLKYVLEKAGAERIGGNALGETVDELAIEFNALRSLNPGLGVAVYHAMLAVAAEERQTDGEWGAIGADYLKLMGFEHCQYLIVRHTDEAHDHVHIVASRIQIPDGVTVSDSQDYPRSEAAIRQLEQTYDLEPVQSSRGQLNSAPSTGEMRRFEKEQVQYEQGNRITPPRPPVLLVLQSLISQLGANQPTMTELVERLRDCGVEVRVSLTKKQTLGISYQFAGEHYSGTQLGAAYQFGGLQRYQGINYEPERDDERICTELGRHNRTTAAAPPAHRPVEPGSPAVAPREFDLGAAIEQLDFCPSAAAEQIREFGNQPYQVAADAGELSDAIERFVEREIFESAAPDFERVCESLERNRAAADHAECLRSEIAEFARTVAFYLEQLQRDQEQAKLEEEEWQAIAITAIESAEQLLTSFGADQPDGSRFVSGQGYQLEQQRSVLMITAFNGQSLLLCYDSADQTNRSDRDIGEVREMADVLEQVAMEVNRRQTLAEIIQSFNPEFRYSVPSLAAIERAQQQVELVEHQTQPLHQQFVELKNELKVSKEETEQASPMQKLLDRWAGEPKRLEKLQLQQRDLARSIVALQREQHGHQREVDSAQASRQREEERLKQMYQELAEQMQTKMGLQERREIDGAVAVVILSSNRPQTERNLEALDFSPAVGQWRRKHSDQPQLTPYVKEIVDAARQQVRESQPTFRRTIVQSQPDLEID